MRYIGHIRAVLVLFLLLSCPAAAEEASSAPAVAIDHLPAFVYDDEDARIHARVIGKAPAENASFSIEARDSEGKVFDALPPQKPGRNAKFVIASSLLGRASSLTLVMEWEGGTETVRVFAVLRAWEKLPPLDVVDGRLETKDNKTVIVLVKHVEEENTRKWFFIRKISGWFKKSKPPGKVALITDLPRLEQDPERPEVRACSRGGKGSSVHALAAVSGNFSVPAGAGAIVMLGNEDIRAGTNRLTFRRSVEAVVQQLHARGIERVRLATPVAPPFHEARLAAYEEVVQKVSRIFKLGKVIDSSEYLSRDVWNADDQGDAQLAKLPAEASKKLSGDLLESWL